MKKLVLTLLITLGVTGLVGCSMPTSLTKEMINNDKTTINNNDTGNITNTGNIEQINTNDAISYNDSIVAIQTKALNAYNEYDKLVENTPLSGNFNLVEEKRKETLKIIKDLQKDLSKIDGYKEDTNLRDAFIKNLSSLITSLEKEEKELIQLYIKRSKTTGDLPKDEVDKEKELLNNIGDRDDQSYKEIVKQQETFANKYNYQLEKEEKE